METNDENHQSQKETEEPTLSQARQSVNEAKRGERYAEYKLYLQRIYAAIKRVLYNISHAKSPLIDRLPIASTRCARE